MNNNRSLFNILGVIKEFDERIASLHFSSVTRRALDFIQDRLGIKRASISIWQKERKGFLLYEVGMKIRGIESGKFLPLKSTVLSQVIRGTGSVYRPNIRDWKPVYDVDKLLVSAGLRADLLIPLIVNKRCIGTLNAGATRVNGISEQKRRILELLAPRFAQAIQNALHIDLIQRSENRFRLLFETLPHGIQENDVQGTITFSNRAHHLMLGYKPGELIGMKIWDMQPSEKDAENLRQYISMLLQDQPEPTPFMTECRTRSGGMIDVQVDWNYKWGINGKIDGFISVITDITERVQAEKALRESEERYRLLVETIPDVTWISDESGCTTFISPNIEKIYGYTPEEIYGGGEKFWLGRIHDEDIGSVRKAYESMFSRNTPFHVEYKIRHKDGRWIWLDDRAVLVYEEGGKKYAYGIFSDITERKKAEASLRESEKKYRSLVESVEENHFIYTHDTSGVFIYLSPSIRKILGYTVQEFMTHYTQYLTDDPVNREVQRHTDLSIQGVRQSPYEVEIYHKDGSIRWLEVSEVPVFNDRMQVTAVHGIAYDITRRKQAQAEIEKARDFYLTLFEDFPALIWRSGIDAQCNYFNRTWLEFTGRTLEQELGDGWTHGIHPDDVGSCVRKYLGAFQAQSPFQMEYRLRHHSGEYRWIVDIGRPFNNLDGSFAGYIGSCYDITGHKKAEDALLQSELRYRKLVDSLTDYIFTVEVRDGQAVSTNHGQGCIGVTGFSSEEYDAKPYLWYDMVHKEDRQRVIRHAEDVLQGGSIQPIEHRIIHKNGTVRWIRNTPVVRYDQDGKLAAYDGLIVDITERKFAEEALQKERDRFQNYLDISAVITVAIDKDQKVVLINKKGCEILGYREDEIIGRNWFDNYIPERHHAAVKNVFSRLMTGESANIEYFENTVVNKKGEERMIAWHNTLLKDDSDAIIGTLSAGEDITERKKIEEESRRLQEQLLQAQKMEAVGMLAGGVAHDFNNILTAIIGYANILKMKIRTDDRTRSNIDQIIASAERGANLTQGLLAFSRKQLIVPQPVDLNVIIREMHNLLRRLISEDITIQVSLQEEGLTIMADRSQIEQIIMNLSTNAKDAMPSGGNLAISTGKITIDELFINEHGFGVPGEYALLSVADTGTGIDEKLQEKIFDPFFTTKEVGRGTGLGLAIVYGIVKQNKGYVTVSSEPGKGAVFHIYLPMIRASVIVHTARHQEPAARVGSETILVAEDDEPLRNLICTILKEFGYTVVEAHDGLSAIERFRESGEKISMLLLDLIMPGKNGKEVYREASRIKPEVKVIFMSGYTSEAIDEKGSLGRDLPFLPKPVMPEHMLKKIREVLDSI